MTLEEARARIGDRVTYHPSPGIVEYGVIKRVSDRYVFVHYDGDTGHKATDAWLLRPA